MRSMHRLAKSPQRCLQGKDNPAELGRKLPSASVNYHRNKLGSNSYLAKQACEPPKPIHITQPEV